jgi:hypothetical protein
MKPDTKLQLLAGSILLALLLICFSIPAEASEGSFTCVTTTDADGYYNSIGYTNGVEIYRVQRGLCVDHQTVRSDNNHIMNDGIKMVDHQEFSGDNTDPSIGVHYRNNVKAIKARHNATQVQIGYMREYLKYKNLLKNL